MDQIPWTQRQLEMARIRRQREKAMNNPKPITDYKAASWVELEAAWLKLNDAIARKEMEARNPLAVLESTKEKT
jgi:hypothetical protein